MRKMFDFSNPLGNVKNSIKKDSLMTDLSAVLTPITYILLPSLFKLSGWTALAVGGLGTWLLGAAFKIDGMKAGAIGAMAVHIVYAKFSGELAKWSVPVWRLGEATQDLDTPGTTNQGIGRLRGVRGMGRLNGYQPNTNPMQLAGNSVLSRPVAGVGNLKGYDDAEMAGSGYSASPGSKWGNN